MIWFLPISAIRSLSHFTALILGMANAMLARGLAGWLVKNLFPDST